MNEDDTGKDHQDKQGRHASDPKAEEALDGYAQQYGGALRRYFLRRGVAQDLADDMVQDVFLRLAARTKQAKIDNPEAYLMQTASSVWNDFLRKKRSRSAQFHVEYEDSAHSPEVFSPERVLESRDELKRFVKVLQELTPRTRQVYLLCRMDGMKRADVARRLGISVSAVDRHLMTAAKKIYQAYGELK